MEHPLQGFSFDSETSAGKDRHGLHQRWFMHKRSSLSPSLSLTSLF
ncbi:unnamed protein product, partial [Brassica rapa subsp. trilocularis]